jgi:hypothetical protein
MQQQGGFGAPGGGYGAPGGGAMVPQGGFGAPQGGFGAPQGGFGAAPAGAGPRPKMRNAIMVLALPIIIIVGGTIVATILASLITPMLGMLALVADIAGMAIGFMNVYAMLNEVKAITQNQAFAWWKILIPILGLIFCWSEVPAKMAKAKQMMGVQTPARSPVLYLLLLPFALASDLNDMAQPTG